MQRAQSKFLELRALSALAHLRFVTRHQIEGSFSGRHRSRQHGGAGEFVDYREYTDGEDLRHLDWRVLARTGRAYVRLYQDETNLVCTLAVDTSGSMGYSGARGGTAGAKLEHVQYLATGLGYLISRQQDQVGLAVLGDGLTDFIEPGATSEHLARVHEGLAALRARGPSNLADGLRDLFGRSRRRGVLLLMSDFLMEDVEDVFAAVRLFRHRHWEVVVLHVVHPEEERLPEGVAYRMVGMEAEGELDCTPHEIRQLYEQRFATHAAAVRALALAARCDYRRVSTAVSYLETLGSFLVERSG